MKLIVIATARNVPIAGGTESWVIRLAGTPLATDRVPADLRRIADQAAREVRETFPGWLWTWCRTEGALDLHRWPSGGSWWWYTPISEKSPLRTPFIREIYWLTLIKRLLAELQVDALEWHGDDAVIAEVVSDLARSSALPFQCHLSSRPIKARLAWLRRVVFSLQHGLCWLALR